MTEFCFFVRFAMIYFTLCPLSNASLYNVIDRAITRTKRRSYVFCSKVFANIYVQGRGGGNVHVKGAGKAGFFKSLTGNHSGSQSNEVRGYPQARKTGEQFCTPTRVWVGRSGSPRGRYGLRNSHSTV